MRSTAAAPSRDPSRAPARTHSTRDSDDAARVERAIQWGRIAATLPMFVHAVGLQRSGAGSAGIWVAIMVLVVTIVAVETLLRVDRRSGSRAIGIVAIAGDTLAVGSTLVATTGDPANPIALATILLALEAAVRWELRGGIIGGVAASAMATWWTIESYSGQGAATPLAYVTFRVFGVMIVAVLTGAIVGRMRATRNRVHTLLDVSSDLIATVDRDGIVRSVNPAARALLGYPPEQAIGRHHRSFLPREPDNDDLLAQLSAAGGHAVVLRRFVHADGHDVWLELSAREVPADGLIYVVGRDVTERRESQRRHLASEQRFRALFERNLDAVVALAADGTITIANEAFRRLSGHPGENVIGARFVDFVSAEDQPHFDQLLTRATAGAAAPGGLIISRGDQTMRHVDLDLLPIIVDDEVVGVFGLVRDVTEQRRRDAQLSFEILHDPLTKLPNRVALNERLAGVLAAGGPVAVLFVDLDDFKQINDDYGHAAGDAVLVATAHRLQESVREGDLVTRLSGDEFCIVLDSADAELAHVIAERIERRLARPVDIGAIRARVGGSVGIAIAEAGDDPATLVDRADAAMYAVKRRRQTSDRRAR